MWGAIIKAGAKAFGKKAIKKAPKKAKESTGGLRKNQVTIVDKRTPKQIEDQQKRIQRRRAEDQAKRNAWDSRARKQIAEDASYEVKKLRDIAKSISETKPNPKPKPKPKPRIKLKTK